MDRCQPLFRTVSPPTRLVSFRMGTIPSFYAIDLVNSLSLTGAAPTLTLPTWGGPVQAIAAGSRWVDLRRRYILFIKHGQLFLASAVHYEHVHSLIKFRGTGTGILVWAYNAGQKYRVLQDGVLIGSQVTAPNTSKMEWITLATSSTRQRNMNTLIIAPQGSVSSYEYAILMTGTTAGTGINPNPVGLYPSRDILLTFGDSIMDCSILTDRAYGWPLLLAINKGYHLVNLGVSGTQAPCVAYNAQPPGSAPRVRTYWQYRREQPAVVIYNYGHNDLAGAYERRSITRLSWKLHRDRHRVSRGQSDCDGNLAHHVDLDTVRQNYNTQTAAAGHGDEQPERYLTSTRTPDRPATDRTRRHSPERGGEPEGLQRHRNLRAHRSARGLLWRHSPEGRSVGGKSAT